MPPTHDGLWPTYTNVVYLNRTLLVPTYSFVPPSVEEKMLRVYQELLPGWKIVPIASDPLLEDYGSLHCATLNIHLNPDYGTMGANRQ
jgi:agmatine/peptidylarginine deiminase